MPKKSKKFIDKKNAVSFSLIHRSQKDPLVADESAPQRILVPVVNPNLEKKTGKKEDNKTEDKPATKEKKKFSVVFDDDYEYLKRLDDCTKTSSGNRRQGDDSDEDSLDRAKIQLPSSVFESEVKNKVGLLHKQVPISGLDLNLDPDVVAALDDDFDYGDPDNQLDDDFMQHAHGVDVADTDEFEIDVDTHDEEYDNFDEEFLQTNSRCEDDNKSRFTEYSMSSSVMSRNSNLSLLDDKFEKMYAGYDENEIGALDEEEIVGHVDENSGALLQCIEEFENAKKEAAENVAELLQNKLKFDNKKFAEFYENEDEEENDLEKLVEVKHDEEWDCESILSTYSNIYNHPKLISDKKIIINSESGIPKNILCNQDGNKLTAKNLSILTKESETNFYPTRSIQDFNVRLRNETSEQRRERKEAVALHKKERRMERKANILAFKEESKIRQKKSVANMYNLLTKIV